LPDDNLLVHQILFVRRTALSAIQITQLNIPPGMIDLGVGQPSPALLPLAAIKTAAEHRLNHDDPSYLAYGAEQGDGHFRVALAQFLSEHYGQQVDPDHLFITAGASQGLDLICTLFAQPGDTIFVEEPTYFLALRIFADHRLNIVGLPMDEDGLIVEALEEKLVQYKPAFLYTIPTFHNPSGVILSASRRAQITHLCHKHNFLVVADEVYHLLAYTTSPPPPLASYAHESTILSLGSFSKILAPGLRLGWIQGRQVLLNRFVKCGLLDSGSGLNPFASGLVRSAIETGLQHAHLEHLKTVYSKRMRALSDALRQHLPDTTSFTEPGGGFFIWLGLPDGVDAEEVLHEALRQNVGFQPGIKFSSRQGLKKYLRLSFAFYDTLQLEEGVMRLAHILKENLKP
jgi:DNA-binding transcriptional MocR family regulator